MNKVAVLLISIFFTFQTTHANSSEKAPFAEAFTLLISDVNFSNKERRTVAKGFQDICGQIYKKIPSLSPRERQWLDVEIQEGRGMALLSSVELAKRGTKHAFGNCEIYSKDFLGKPGASDIREAYAWTILLREILAPYLSTRLETLQNKKVATFSKHELAVVSSFSDLSYRVLGKIVTPLLSSGIDEKK
jgi:hypothetical protein